MKALPRILLACTSAGALVLARMLAGEAELIPVFSLDEAMTALAQHVDLILCMTRFDDSRMFDLLSVVHERFASVPFVACDIATGALDTTIRKAAEAAAMIVGARAFIDLSSPEGADGHRLREALDAILQPPRGT
jgi:hypothetical protein